MAGEIVADLLRGGLISLEIAAGAWLLAAMLGLALAVLRDLGMAGVRALRRSGAFRVTTATPSVTSSRTSGIGLLQCGRPRRRPADQTTSGPAQPDQVAQFSGDDDIAYELGTKLDLLDRRIRLNADVFYTDFSQRTTTIGGAEALQLQLQAAGADVSPFLMNMIPYLLTLLVLIVWGMNRQSAAPAAPAGLAGMCPKPKCFTSLARAQA